MLFCACSQPTSTSPTYSGTMVFDGYGQNIDSSYYKVWSDSSWEEFYHDTTIGGAIYSTILDASGDQYFYDSLEEYCGFELPQIYGVTAILFDKPLPALPDTVVGSQTYVLQTTFFFQNVRYILMDNETLVDTSTFTVPFGTFIGCPGIRSNQSITSNGLLIAGSDELYWTAKGPSIIVRDLLDYGYAIEMVYGVVNGKGWGVAISKMGPEVKPTYLILAAPVQSVAKRQGAGIDIQSAARAILKGIIRLR